MRLVRTPHAALGPLCLALGLSSCFGHHTSDEVVLKNATAPNEGRDDEDDDVIEEDEEDDAPRARDSGTRVTDAGRATDAGANAQCAQMTDPIARALCSAAGGSIDDIINGILGGGTGTSCARETDPIALILCQATSGAGGIEGIINGLFGGRDAGTTVRRDAGTTVRRDAGVPRDAGVRDAGVPRDAGVRADSGAAAAPAALIQAIQRILEDLITALFGGTRNAALVLNGDGTSDKSAGADLERSEEQCAEVSPDDLLTRLVCARQAVETLSAEE